MNSPTNLDTLLKEILITPLVGAMMERGIKPARKAKCECVTEYAMNGDPGRLMDFPDEDCRLCDGEGWQKRDKPLCEECGEPSTHVLDSEDRCPTDRGTEVRNVKVYLCRECFQQFMERGR